jgi:ribokinase
MALLGRAGPSLDDDAIEEVAAGVRDLGVATAIVKLGARGVAIADRAGVRRLAGTPVPVVDTTAAGDTFNGALAVALAEGHAIDAATGFANAAAALSVTRTGAQASIPGRDELERFRRSS